MISYQKSEPTNCSISSLDVIMWRTFLKNDDQIRMLVVKPKADLAELAFVRAYNLARFCCLMLEALDNMDTIGIRQALNKGLEIAYGRTLEHKWGFEHFKASLSGDLKPDLEPIACAKRAIAAVEAAKAEKTRPRRGRLGKR